jgi:hypothetical protein
MPGEQPLDTFQRHREFLREVGGVVSQQASTDQLFFLPQTPQASLRFLQGVALLTLGRGFLLGQELLETIPKGLRGETLGLKTPEGIENGLPIPVSGLGHGTGSSQAVESCQQQVMRGGRAEAGLAPQRVQQSEDPGLLGQKTWLQRS